MEKQIELTPLAEIGKGSARVTDDSVELEISGISGGMKAWLIGGEAVPIGNIVEGKLAKKIDTKRHTGILVTQCGRQMLIGKYSEEEETLQEEVTPFEVDGFNWRKVTNRDYSSLCRELRYILSNTDVYKNYRKYGHYWVGESNEAAAIALPQNEDEVNPFEFAGKMKLGKNGYVIVCVDKKTKKLYLP